MSTSRPFFSVIIPVHNKMPHISRAIKSVLKQKFIDFELIIVDDASTDRSLEIISGFSDYRIKVFKRKTPGPGGYAARNLGIKEANAEWIAFLDADDEWSQCHLSELNGLIRKFPEVSIVSTSWKTVSTTDEKEDANLFRKKNLGIQFKIIDYFGYLYSSASGQSPFCTIVVSIKRATLINIGGFPEGKSRRGGDVDTWLRAMAYSKFAAWSAKITATYYRDSINMVTKMEAFTGLCEKYTTDMLKSKETDIKLKTLLMKFSNARLISGYIQTVTAGFTQNKNLFRNLHIYYLTPKQLCIVILSFFPETIFRLMHKTCLNLKMILKKNKIHRTTLNRISVLGFLLSTMRVTRDYIYYTLTSQKVNVNSNYEYRFLELKTNTFCGYYDISPFHPEKSDHILINSTTANPFLPPDKSKPCEILVVNYKDNSIKNIDITFAWNWQQGCRSGWIDNHNIIYNVYEEGKYFSKIYNIKNESKKSLKYPVMAWHKDKLYCAVDFSVLNKRNKDYGYNAHKKNFSSNMNFGIAILNQDSSEMIWKMDLNDALTKVEINKSREIEKTYFFNHPMFSSDGENMLFLFRYIVEFKKNHYTFCWNKKNNQADLILKDKVSHYSWIDNNRFIYWGTYAGIDGYHIVDIRTKNVDTVNDTLSDGHPTKADDNRFIIDSYVFPFIGRIIRWLDVDKGRHERIASVAESPTWSYISRCDPHPSVDSKHDMIQIDTMIGGKRRVLIVKKK